MNKQNENVARCPHCGGDEFQTSESEIKTVRLTGTTNYPYYREEVLSSEGKGYDNLICGDCGKDLNPHEMLEEIVPDSVKQGG